LKPSSSPSRTSTSRAQEHPIDAPSELPGAPKQPKRKGFGEAAGLAALKAARKRRRR
jgi:hypothetical protein